MPGPCIEAPPHPVQGCAVCCCSHLHVPLLMCRGRHDTAWEDPHLNTIQSNTSSFSRRSPARSGRPQYARDQWLRWMVLGGNSPSLPCCFLKSPVGVWQSIQRSFRRPNAQFLALWEVRRAGLKVGKLPVRRHLL